MFDIGFTFSLKPQFGLYGNCPFTAPGGYTNVDGYFAGIGGGKIGVMEHHQRAAGFLVGGAEDVSWGSADSPEGETKSRYGVGFFGLNTDEQGNPVYRPQCAHYLHLGFIGVTANLNYKDWPDFFLGWVGLDPRGDDGRGEKRAASPGRLQSLEARLSRSRDGLRLLARTTKARYAPDEPIVLEVELHNVAGRGRGQGEKPRDIEVYFEPVAKDQRGETSEWLLKFYAYEVYSGRQRYASPKVSVPAERRAELYHRVTLPPGAFVGRRFTFAPARQWLRPGDHFFLASYEVTKDSGMVILHPELTTEQVKKLGNEHAYVPVWTGKIYSNLATFRVERKKLAGLF